MVDPTKVDFWYKESDLRLTNLELLALARLLVVSNSYPKAFRKDCECPESLESKIKTYFIKCRLDGIPDAIIIA